MAFGLLFAMILTLFVVPSAYDIVDTLSTKARRRTSEIVIGQE